jgi:hypothetical protein
MDDLLAYLSYGKTALDILKGLRELLPKGAKSDEAQKEIEKAEEALQASKAELAKKLGFRLCRCRLPPPIMLWNNDRRVNVCPDCGNTYPPKPKFEPLKSRFR